MIDYVETVRTESARFSEVIHDGDMARGVPSCPDWRLSDLAWHLTEVQHFWGEIVEGLLQSPDQTDDLDRPDDAAALPDLFDERSARLLRVLAMRDPGDECWSWHGDGGSVGWIRRRQAHEALIHRVDAELAVERRTDIDTLLASDGIDEMLASQIDGPVPEWGSLTLGEEVLRLHTRDTDRDWDLRFARFQGTSPVSGNTYDLPTVTRVEPVDAPDAVVEGTAVDLDLWLWGRGPLDRLQVEGEEWLAPRLREIAAEAGG